MKKITVAVFALVIVLSLVSCGGNPGSSQPTPAVPASSSVSEPTTSQSPAVPASSTVSEPTTSRSTLSTAAPTAEAWVKPVLNLAQQQNEISYRVPSTWKQKEDAVGVYYYPYSNTEDSNLYINCEFPEGLETVDIDDSNIYRQLLDGMVGGLEDAGFTIIEKTYVKIAGKDAVRIHFKKPFGNRQAEGIISSFITQTAVYSFTVSEPEPLSKEFEEVYNAILESVTLG